MAQNASAEAAAVPSGPRREVLIILPGLLLAIMLAMLDHSSSPPPCRASSATWAG